MRHTTSPILYLLTWPKALFISFLLFLASLSIYAQQITTIIPVTAGKASGGGYFPMERAFDSQPTWDNGAQTPVGGAGGDRAPAYGNREGYIDFGPNYATLRITSSWTLYMPWSPGDQTPHAQVWWDDDNDNINDDGTIETRLSFNSAQGLPNAGGELWVRDGDFSADPIIPAGRYLICKAPASMTNRAKEYALVGYVFDALNVPSNLLASNATATMIELTWTDNSTNETGFEVERSTSSGSGFERIHTSLVDETAFTDTGLWPNTTYYYRLRASNADGYSMYSNELMVSTTLSEETEFLINGTPAVVASFTTDQDDGTFQIIDNQSTLFLQGNSWKQAAFNYVLTPNTILELDFKSTDEGEIQGIGFDNDITQDQQKIFQLYGAQVWGIQSYNDYSGSDWKHYVIRVGDHFTGSIDRLVFVGDEDRTGANQNGYFRNISVYEENNHDSRSNALLLSDLTHWQSSPEIYTNAAATNDGPTPSVYTTLGNNVWFKFQAQTNGMQIKLNLGSLASDGFIMGLFDASDHEVDASRFNMGSVLSSNQLVPGAWYYLSVGSLDSNSGTFGLSLNDDLGNDFKEDALDISLAMNPWDSGPEIYDNLNASKDGPAPSVHTTLGNNVWFKFQAQTNGMQIKLNLGSLASDGFIMGLFDANDNELDASRFNMGSVLSSNQLVPGAWYYLSVGSLDSNSGTFGLMLNDDLGNDFKSDALDITSDSDSWTSGSEAYDNYYSSNDGPQTSLYGPLRNNIWFKFQPKSDVVQITLNRGTMSNTYVLALFDSSDQELAATRFNQGSSLSLSGLDTNEYYYLSVGSTIEDGASNSTFGLEIEYSSSSYPIAWTNMVGVNSIDGVLTKTSANGWFHGASSLNTLESTQDGWIEFTIGAAQYGSDKRFEIGFSDLDVDQGQVNIDYSFNLSGLGFSWQYNNGIHGNTSYSVGDVLRLERSGSQILYKINGQLLHTIDNEDPSIPLIADVSIYDQGLSLPVIRSSFSEGIKLNAALTQVLADGTKGSIEVTPIYGTAPYSYNWSNGATTSSITNLDPGSYTVTVTGAGGKQKTETYHIGYRVVWTNLFGVADTDGVLQKTTANNFTNSGASSLNVLEAGQDGWFEFEVTSSILGGDKRFEIGLSDVDVDQSNNTIDYSFYLTGTAAEWQEQNTKLGNSYYFEGDVLRIERTGSSMVYARNGRIVRTVTGIDNSVPLIVDVAIFDQGLTLPVISSSFSEGIRLDAALTHELADGTKGSIDVTPTYGTAPYSYNWSNGSTTSSITDLDPGSYTVTVTGAGGKQKTETYHIGYRVVWTNLFGVADTDGILQKTTANNFTNSGASSLNVLEADQDGWFEFEVTSWILGGGDKRFEIGLSDVDVDQSNNTIDYSFYLTGTAAEWQEHNTKLGNSYYFEGDVLRIERTGNSMVYTRNSRIVRTVTGIDNSIPLIVDVAIFDQGLTLPVISSSFSDVASEPTIPSSNLTFSEITENSMRVSWTNGDGEGRILMSRERQLLTPTGRPKDGTEYHWDTNASTAPGIGPNKIIYAGSDSSSILVTGLGFNTFYGFAVFEYNGSGNTIDYLTGLSANAGQYTLGASPEPTEWASLLVIDSITDNSAHVSWVRGNGERNLVRVRETENLTVNGRPKDGLEYTFDTHFPSATSLGSPRVVYVGDENHFKLTGLSANTRYSLGIFDFNGMDSTTNYLYTSPQISFYTINGSVDDNVELQALRDLYESTHGDQWNSQTDADPANDWPRTDEDWNQITSINQTTAWQGISNLNGDVRFIQFNDNGLQGTIPESITNLTNLTRLILSNNQLTGNLPQHLDQLVLLERLQLDNNSLSGTISEIDFSEFPKLIYLHLQENELNGVLPASLTSLPSLEQLYLQNNDFQGLLPEFGINQDQLQYINLSDNRLHGSIPSALFSLPGLITVYLENNNFTSLPHFTSSNPSSNVRLYVRYNYLSEEDISVNEANAAFELFLARPQKEVNGLVPDGTELQALRDLYESTGGDNWTSQTDADPTNDWPRTALEWEAITSMDQITGWHGVVLVSGDVTELNLNDNNLINHIPENIGNLSELVKLRLEGNQLEGGVPNSVFDLTQLSHLYLQNNQLSGPIPDQFDQIPQLKYIKLNDNAFTGGVPSSMASLNSLTHLNLANLDLTVGPIPDWIRNKTQLNGLLLGGTNRVGTIPTWWNELVNLEILDLAFNNLEGSVPSELGNLTNLTQFYVHDNASVTEVKTFSNIPDTVQIQRCGLDFSSIEQFLNADGTPKPVHQFLYSPQNSSDSLVQIDAFLNESITVQNSRVGGTNTLYQWEEWNGTTWVNVDGQNSANLNLPIINLDDDGRRFRCKMTNTLITGMTLYSEEYVIQVIIQQTFYAIADGNWSDPNIWSLTEDGPSDARVPTRFDDVQIGNYQIEVTENVDCREVNISASSNTGLLVSGREAKLTVNGEVIILNQGAVENKIVQVTNGGTIECK